MLLRTLGESVRGGGRGVHVKGGPGSQLRPSRRMHSPHTAHSGKGGDWAIPCLLSGRLAAAAAALKLITATQGLPSTHHSR